MAPCRASLMALLRPVSLVCFYIWMAAPLCITAWEYHSVIVLSYKVAPAVNEAIEIVNTDNLGFCSSKCSANNACTVAHFVHAQMTCLLSSATNPVWSYQPESAILVKVQMSSVSETSQYQVMKGALINGAYGLQTCQGNYTFQRVGSLSYCQRICTSMRESCFAFSFHAFHLTCVVISGNVSQEKLSVDMADGNWTAFYLWNQPAAVVDDSYRQASGVLIKSGQSEKTESYTYNDVATAASCQRMCELLTNNCSVFAHHSTLLTCKISVIDFYDDWTNIDSSDSRWNSYYKIRSSGTKLLLKVSKEIGIDISDVWRLPGHTNASASASEVALNASCRCYVKSQVAELQSKFNITKIKMVMASNGREIKFLNLDATGTTLDNVFVQSRIRESSWTDLSSTATIQIMSLGVSSSNWYGRYFYIQKGGLGSCNTDQVWMTIHGWTGSTPCIYDQNPVPRFVYSNLSTADTVNLNTFYADVFLVYAWL